MAIISKETLEKTWKCHREIEASEKLLKDIQEVKKNNFHDPYAQKLKDSFGHRRDFELGVPSGENGHRIFNVNIDLARSIILAHKAKMLAELEESNEQIKIELDS